MQIAIWTMYGHNAFAYPKLYYYYISFPFLADFQGSNDMGFAVHSSLSVNTFLLFSRRSILSIPNNNVFKLCTYPFTDFIREGRTSCDDVTWGFPIISRHETIIPLMDLMEEYGHNFTNILNTNLK